MLDDRVARWLDAGGDPTIVVDAGGSIVHASRQVQASPGYDSAELVGQPVAVLVPEAVRAAHEHHVRWYAKDPQSREMGIRAGPERAPQGW